jgi:hypothetical protein
MVLEEILTKLPQLTTREQLLLLEALSRTLRTNSELTDQDAVERTAFWASFGAWQQTPGEPTLEALVAERRSKSEPPTL